MFDLPDRLPMLSAGAHASPDDGACLMEFVSLLAGERWSDSPRCTHPVLAAVARCVNDEMSTPRRQNLVPFAPELIGLHGIDQRLGAAVTLVCVDRALALTPDSRSLRRHQRLAWRILRKGDRHSPRLTDLVYDRLPAMHAIAGSMRAMRSLRQSDRDVWLAELMRAAVETAREFSTPATGDRQHPSLAFSR
jgi:hypothetical protein